MSLRLRLIVIIGLALAVLWGAASVWMWQDVTHDLQRMLDNRLAMSANMVAGLLGRQLTVERMNDGVSAIPNRRVTIPAQQGMACQIRSMRGRIIAATQGAPASLSAKVEPGYDTRTIDGTAWRTFTLRANGLSITTADRLAGRQMLRRQIALTVGIPFLIAAVGGLLTVWLGTTRGLRPLKRLRQDLARRGPDALDPLDTAHLPGELKPPVETLNRLLHRTDQAMRRERHFTNDAAHELRTPLTAISTHLQVARVTSGDDAATALADVEAGVGRLQSTVEQLLLLARVEGRLPFDETDAVDAETVLQRALADSGSDAKRVGLENTAGTAVPRAAPALAVAALRNLLDNALTYAPGDSPVTVRIEADERMVRFRVCDCGPGLDGAEVAQAVQRFWRAGPRHGSGLGLTVVDAIASRYDGRLVLTRSRPGFEACLELPRADGEALETGPNASNEY